MSLFNTVYQYEVWVPLIHPLFWNLCMYWSLYVIIYCNSSILPRQLIWKNIETYIQGVTILFFISISKNIYIQTYRHTNIYVHTIIHKHRCTNTNTYKYICKYTYTQKIYVYALKYTKGCPRGVIVKVMDCGIVVREFILQSRYYVHFRANTLGKGMNPLILPAMG